MFYQRSVALFPTRVSRFQTRIIIALLLMALAPCGSADHIFAQGFEKELNAPEKVEVRVKNLRGRVTVIAAAELDKKIVIRAESPKALTGDEDVRAEITEGKVEITTAPARDESRGGSYGNGARRGGTADDERIDLVIRVPLRARVKIETGDGAADVVGNVASAEVATATGTIRADVPLDALKYSFQWTASRPRFFSEVELPEVKERRGGVYEIAGRFGDKDAKETERINLELVTSRGVVLFGVSDPATVPSDLRPRPLTESARAIIRSGDEDLTEAIRKVAPRLVGDYTQTLPPPKGDSPGFAARPKTRPPLAAPIDGRLARLNASVTDRNGRAVAGLTEKDFTVFVNGEPRPVHGVAPATAPFNLVLLLDVSGSVEERLDFIRKAALSFLNTVNAQDRIAIISFRDDVQLISEFTADRTLLAARIKKIEAGGGTALYDSLAYTLVHTLQSLRGERTAVVILSDGDDNKSFIPFPEVLEATMESGALVYPLYIPSGLIPADTTPTPTRTLDPVRTRFLTLTSRAEEEGRKLASVSGGVYYPVTRLDQLQRAYDDVVAQLRTAYTITYASNATADGGDAREARVRVRVNTDGVSVRLSPSVSVAAP
ncbi:MAG TPA: VWA domain-containing protein [Pyrinomonadaceae bacterium]|nr:VWA domain-containing protein [Pyrinomonadaceae bacterium]